MHKSILYIVSVLALSAVLYGAYDLTQTVWEPQQENIQRFQGNIQSDQRDQYISQESLQNGFPDQSSKNLTDAQKNALITISQAASAYYSADLQKNLQYIKQTLITKLGYQYFIVIETQHASLNYTYYSYLDKYLTINGINLVNKKWSYFFASIYNTTTLNDTTMLPGTNNLTDEKLYVVQNVIENIDSSGWGCQCTQEKAKAIQQKMEFYDSQKWMVFCSSKSSLAGVGRVINGEYFNGKTSKSKCYWFLTPHYIGNSEI